MVVDLYYLIPLVGYYFHSRAELVGALQLEQLVQMVAGNVVKRIGLV